MKQVIQMELQQRKPNRLKEYDYSQNGAYFITICVQNRHEILCKIVDSGYIGNDKSRGAGLLHSRGAGTSPPTIGVMVNTKCT